MDFLYFAGDEEKVEIDKSDEPIQKDEIKDETKVESLTLKKNEVEMKDDWETEKKIKVKKDVKKETKEESEVKEERKEEKEVKNRIEDDNITNENVGDAEGE